MNGLSWRVWRGIVRLMLLLALVAEVASVSGEDWPQFRGPTGQGHSRTTNLPVTWTNSDNVVWKQAIPGQGWSSPTVVDGVVYLTAAVADEETKGTDFSLRLLRLRADTGETLGSVEVFRQAGASAPKIHGKNSHASPTPIVDNGQVFVHFGHQGVACLDLKGNVVWRNSELSYAPVHGNGGSPLLAGKALVFSGDGAEKPFVVALDRNSGQMLWKTERQSDAARKFSFSTPLLIEVGGQAQVVSPGSNCVCGYDLATGKEIWRVRYDGYSVIPRPVFGNGLLYVCTGYGTPSLLAIRPDGVGDVTDTHVVWTASKGVPHTPSLLLIGDDLYLVSDRGIASCLDAKTGEAVWQERVAGNYSASPVFADGRIYLLSETGDGVVLRIGRTFEQLAVNVLGERTLASYAVADGALFIRSEKHLYRIAGR